MSEPITLTERERAVLESLFSYLKSRADGHQAAGVSTRPREIIEWMQEWSFSLISTESASPPRVPVSSAHFTRVGVQSGPGQPIDIEALPYCRDPGALAWTKAAAAEIRRLRERSDTLRIIEEAPTSYYKQGFRAGIEAAAQYHDEQAAEWSECYTKNGNNPSAREYAKQHRADAAAIRPLADKPAPDAARKGG